MTTNESLLDSCTTIFSRQGISLHYNTQDNTATYETLGNKQKIYYVIFVVLSTNQIIYIFSRIGIILSFY